jgi:O-antigen/teichoic acid export membrane protein
MSLKATVKSGLIWTLFQNFGSQVVNLVVSMILARLLMPADFGIIAMVTVMYSISLILVDTGLEASIIRTANITDIDYSSIFVYNVVVSLVLYVLLFLFSPFIADFFNEPRLSLIIKVLALNIIFIALSTVQKAKMEKEMRFRVLMQISIVCLIVSGIVGVVVAMNKFGVWSLVYMNVTSAALNVILLWKAAHWTPSLKFNKSVFKGHFNFGYKIGLATILHSVFREGYTFIIGKFFSPATLGYYNRSNNLMMLPAYSIGGALNRIALPLFSKMNTDDDSLRDVFAKVLKLGAFVVAPVVCCMWAYADELIYVLFGKNWGPSVPYFRIIAIISIFYTLNMYNLYILSVKGRSDIGLKAEVYKKIINVIIIAITITMGLEALLWGSVLIIVIEFFINAHYSGSMIAFSVFNQAKEIFAPLAISIGCGLLGYWFASVADNYISSKLVMLIAGSAFYGILYILLSWLVPHSGFKTFINFIFKK